VIRGKSKSFTGASFPAMLVLATLACSGGAEYLALQKFFEASRLRDRTALRSISTVSFEPMADGTLTTFKITSLGPEERQPLGSNPSAIRLAELSLSDPRRPLDVSRAEGELVSKDVRLSAEVRLPNGQTARRTVSVVLQRAVVKGDLEVTGRWIVTGFVMHG
jgi:hypothetical protein